jgi:hypothetical protein
MIKHYLVTYHDSQNDNHDLCTYAESCWDAEHVAIEDDSYLHEHPHAITSIIKED